MFFNLAEVEDFIIQLSWNTHNLTHMPEYFRIYKTVFSNAYSSEKVKKQTVKTSNKSYSCGKHKLSWH